jgi:hypothetical protein
MLLHACWTLLTPRGVIVTALWEKHVGPGALSLQEVANTEANQVAVYEEVDVKAFKLRPAIFLACCVVVLIVSMILLIYWRHQDTPEHRRPFLRALSQSLQDGTAPMGSIPSTGYEITPSSRDSPYLDRTPSEGRRVTLMRAPSRRWDKDVNLDTVIEYVEHLQQEFQDLFSDIITRDTEITKIELAKASVSLTFKDVAFSIKKFGRGIANNTRAMLWEL